MTDKALRDVVVPAEKATFWMDCWGNWCNRHGRFEHRKIIAHFNAAIARDAQGYFVSQINDDVREKVYFRYEETALFVFDVRPGEALTLVLNTGREVGLEPGMLFIRNDHLYAREGGELIKFNEASMLKISRFFDHVGDQCFLNYKGQRAAIPIMEDRSST
jgi:hypothetical protein